jgi:pSer/pThr/pTyr-binding forkhead associated (FHA) protein
MHVGLVFSGLGTQVSGGWLERDTEGLPARPTSNCSAEYPRCRVEHPFAMRASENFHQILETAVSVSRNGNDVPPMKRVHYSVGAGTPEPLRRGERRLGGHRMADEDQISDDPGTVLDSFENISSLLEAGHPASAPRQAGYSAKPTTAAHCEEVLYRSPIRPSAPRITILDDGSLEAGEVAYVRTDRITIGRAKGDILIGHDAAMSATHAEIVRRNTGGRYSWFLRDLGSSNGTLVRCRSVALRANTTLLIGSKRYLFEVPKQVDYDEDLQKTFLQGHPLDSAPPGLVEIPLSQDAKLRRFPFSVQRISIGRPGLGNDVELDDPCIAKLHAVAACDSKGAWQMQAQPSLNGLWVKVDSVKLSDGCLFQCGEQRFRFQL